MELQRIVLILGVLSATGCTTDLSSVQKFGALSSSLTSEKSVVQSYPDAYSTQITLLSTIDPKVTQCDAKPNISPYCANYARLGSNLTAAQKSAEADQKGFDMLNLYSKTLSQLAGDQLVTTGDSVKAIINDLQKPGLVSSKAAGPATQIGTAIESALLNGVRESAVRVMISNADGPLQDLCAYLSTVMNGVQTDWRANVGLLDQAYQVLRERNNRAVVFLLNRDEANQSSEMTTKAQQAAALSKALDNIATTHGQLKDQVGHLSSQQVKKTVTDFVNTVVPLLGALGVSI